MTKTECKWGRETLFIPGDGRHFHLDDAEETILPMAAPTTSRQIGTSCGGAECPDRRKGPERRRWCRGVTWQDGDRRAPGQETDRRKGERRQGRELHGRGRFWIDNKKIALGFCWPKDNRSGKDRRQPVCSNPECGEGVVQDLLGKWWHSGSPHPVEEYRAADPPGRDEGRCRRGREHRRAERDLPGLIQKGIEAVDQFADDALVEKPQSAGLVKGPTEKELARDHAQWLIGNIEVAGPLRRVGPSLDRLCTWPEQHERLARALLTAEAQAARYRGALEAVHPQLVKLAQEAWPDGDLYLHGSKFQGKTIPALTLRRLQQAERDVSEALQPEPDYD